MKLDCTFFFISRNIKYLLSENVNLKLTCVYINNNKKETITD